MMTAVPACPSGPAGGLLITSLPGAGTVDLHAGQTVTPGKGLRHLAPAGVFHAHEQNPFWRCHRPGHGWSLQEETTLAEVTIAAAGNGFNGDVRPASDQAQEPLE